MYGSDGCREPGSIGLLLNGRSQVDWRRELCRGIRCVSVICIGQTRRRDSTHRSESAGNDTY